MAVPKKIASALVFLLCLAVLKAPGHAALSGESHVSARLISEVSSISPGQPFWVALRMKMDPHWHTYWLNPGDSGLATTLDWKLPEGFTTGPIQWPYPERIDVSSLISFGFEGEIYLLQEIRPPASLPVDQTVDLALKAEWLVCKEICLPGGADLRLSLPVRKDGGKADPSAAADFAKAREGLPVSNPKIGMAARADGEKLVLSVEAPASAKVFFFPETPGEIPPSGEQVLKKTERGFDLQMSLEPKTDLAGKTLRGVLVAEGGLGGPEKLKAIRIGLPVEKLEAKKVAEWSWATLLPAIFSALAGGLILNLMPCVFPVLSIKVLGFVRQSESRPGEVKLQGLLFGAGVLASFLILAGLLLFLREGGDQLGWGFQLQSPLFVGGLAVLFFAIGLNLMGVFEVGTSLMGLGAVAGSGGGRLESFFSGVLATLVATPCTAPFMGSALGFALSQPAAGALMIFAGLGTGMAAPYVVLSFFPQLGRYLPKPGAWMESFKQWMAFPLFATVIWLLWVLGLQVDMGGVTAVLVALLAVAMAAWIYGRWGNPARTVSVQWTAKGAALVLLFCGLAYARENLQAAETEEHSGTVKTDAYGQVWEPYSPERVEALRTEGRPVYIDFTAAWCATCQVNKRLVFGSAEVRNKIKELNVALVKGDWTRRDPVITRALESFDRAGVPLNVLYGKGPDAQPRVLPEVLTAGIVLEALNGL